MYTRRFSALALLGCFLVACGDPGIPIPHATGVELIRAQLAARGIHAVATDRVLSPVVTCPPAPTTALVASDGCATWTLPLDGWDPSAEVGFVYLTFGPDDNPKAKKRLLFRDADALQAVLDARTDTDETILIISEAVHETFDMAQDVLTGRVEARLEDHGL